jgi:hypothetical protein
MNDKFLQQGKYPFFLANAAVVMIYLGVAWGLVILTHVLLISI